MKSLKSRMKSVSIRCPDSTGKMNASWNKKNRELHELKETILVEAK